MRGKKLPPEDIYAIMASYAVTGDYAQTAKDLGKPESTVTNIVRRNRDKPEFAELGAKKRAEFSERASVLIDKALERLEQMLDNPDVNIPANQLTVVVGTLYDKRALSEGEATGNADVNINIKIV